MSLNVDALNPCLSIKSKLEKSLLKLDAIKYTMGPVTSALSSISDASARIDNGLVGTVSASLSAGLSTTLTNMDSLTESMSALTGTCLKTVTDDLKDLAVGGAAKMGSVMDSIGSVTDTSALTEMFGDMSTHFLSGALAPVSSIIGKVASMDSLTKNLGISDHLKGMDEMLGCLAESTCGDLVDPSVIDGYFSHIQGFLTDFALDDQGNVVVAHVLDTLGVGTEIADAVTASSNVVQDVADAVKEKAVAQINSSVTALVHRNLF